LAFSCTCKPIENEFPRWDYSIHVAVTRTNISHNQALFGGGVSVKNAKVLIEAGTMEWNRGQEGGGGLYLGSGSASAELLDMTLQNNYGKDADVQGLSIEQLSAGSLTISGTTKLFLGGNTSEVYASGGTGE
jgi:hypothetical protein